MVLIAVCHIDALVVWKERRWRYGQVGITVGDGRRTLDE